MTLAIHNLKNTKCDLCGEQLAVRRFDGMDVCLHCYEVETLTDIYCGRITHG